MKSKILLILIISLSSIYAKNPWREDEMEISIKFSKLEDIQIINELNLMGDIYKKEGLANLYVIPRELERIKEAGLSFEIIQKDLKGWSNKFWDEEINRATYMTYDEIITLMNNLANSYPNICRKEVYGESVEGRELSALKISDNVNDDEPEPEVLFDGGIHGDELGGPENVARFATLLCEAYGSDSKITELVNTREIWLFCMVNPDGRVYVSRANASQVDLNRNWGFMWNGECYTNSGFSQPETKAIRDCILENQYSIQVSKHSGIEAIFLPWCYTSNSAPEYSLHESLANIYLSTSDYGSFEICQSNHDYPTTGETVDFSYGVMGTAALTMELSSQKQPNNPIDIYNKNENAMIKMVELSGEGIEGFVTDLETGEPVAACLYFNNSYPSYNDPEVGDYHKYLNPGNYEIRVEANGYKSKVINSVTISHNRNSAIEDIELEPDTGNSIYGYRVVYLKKCNGYSYNVLGKKDGEELSLGNNGKIIIDMQYNLYDQEGNDLTVYASGGSFECEVARNIDGPWSILGMGNGKYEFDFNGNIADSVRYVSISGSNVVLDAVEAKKDMATNIAANLNKSTLKPVIGFNHKKISISNLISGKSTISFFNALGQLCFVQKTRSHKATVDVSEFPKGLYFMKIQNGFNAYHQKVSISN